MADDMVKWVIGGWGQMGAGGFQQQGCARALGLSNLTILNSCLPHSCPQPLASRPGFDNAVRHPLLPPPRRPIASKCQQMFLWQGLGKTMQCSAFLAGSLGAGAARRALVVAPKTLLAHWWVNLVLCTSWVPEGFWRDAM